MRQLDVVAWAICLGLGSVLWASGVILFPRSSLSRPWKTAWTLFLVSMGVAIGYIVPLPGIHNRFLVLVVGLPVLAVIDAKLAKSSHRLSFWFRACSYEICTVFGAAAATRLVVEWITSVR